jgi:lipopolysaccharide biosynthesis glycosyltransferase
MTAVVFCFDSNMFNIVPVVVASIAQHNTLIDFHLVCNEEVPDALIQQITFLMPTATVTPHTRQWTHPYYGCQHITCATMIRLLLPEILCTLDKVLYLDLDLLVHIDLAKLFAIDTGETGFAMRTSNPWKHPLVRVFSNQLLGGNAGVMVMNLELLRKMQFVAWASSQSTGVTLMTDQDIINNWCRGKHSILPNHWNLFNSTDFAVVGGLDEYILHFAGKCKPYQTSVPNQHLWEACVHISKHGMTSI